MKMQKHPIYWITGQSGAGKTTLAYVLQKKIGGVVLDGDEMRASISLGAGFSKEDREEHNLRVARLADVLSRQTIVIVSVIAPFESTREKITQLINPVWIYVAKNLPEHPDRPYEIPRNSHITLDSDVLDADEKAEKVLEYLKTVGRM